jgi:hypothetical protein
LSSERHADRSLLAERVGLAVCQSSELVLLGTTVLFEGRFVVVNSKKLKSRKVDSKS